MIEPIETEKNPRLVYLCDENGMGRFVDIVKYGNSAIWKQQLKRSDNIPWYATWTCCMGPFCITGPVYVRKKYDMPPNNWNGYGTDNFPVFNKPSNEDELNISAEYTKSFRENPSYYFETLNTTVETFRLLSNGEKERENFTYVGSSGTELTISFLCECEWTKKDGTKTNSGRVNFNCAVADGKATISCPVNFNAYKQVTPISLVSGSSSVGRLSVA